MDQAGPKSFHLRHLEIGSNNTGSTYIEKVFLYEMWNEINFMFNILEMCKYILEVRRHSIDKTPTSSVEASGIPNWCTCDIDVDTKRS